VVKVVTDIQAKMTEGWQEFQRLDHLCLEAHGFLENPDGERANTSGKVGRLRKCLTKCKSSIVLDSGTVCYLAVFNTYVTKKDGLSKSVAEFVEPAHGDKV
jgi:hypothetical protein